LHQDLFDCPGKCTNPSDRQKVVDWYANTCGYTEAGATAIAAGQPYDDSIKGGKKDTIAIIPPVHHKLKWYEILAIWAAGMTAFVFVVISLWIYFLNRTRKQSQWETQYQSTPDRKGSR